MSHYLLLHLLVLMQSKIFQNTKMASGKKKKKALKMSIFYKNEFPKKLKAS